MSTVAILGTRYPDFVIEEGVLAGVEIVAGPGATPDEIVELAGDADVILIGSLPRFTGEVLQRLSCRALVRSGIGVDNVDLEVARALGYTVAYVPDYGTEAVAQHTLALALAANRRLGEADRLVRQGDWGFASLRPLHLPSAMTAGVVGFGRIGRRTAELLHAVGFGRIVVHDAYLTPDVGWAEPVSLDELLSTSDLVTLHAPGPQGGGALIGPAEVGRMKPGSAIVNTARGSLIDPVALAAGLAVGAPTVAALDVFSPEPPDLAPFDGVIDRMILSPHAAWYTEESQADLRRKSAEEAARMLVGQAPLNAVIQPQEES
jgi:D-3-phosphoglycerate dehydrogenase / 2-oxoglutarate reductase